MMSSRPILIPLLLLISGAHEAQAQATAYVLRVSTRADAIPSSPSLLLGRVQQTVDNLVWDIDAVDPGQAGLAVGDRVRWHRATGAWVRNDSLPLPTGWYSFALRPGPALAASQPPGGEVVSRSAITSSSVGGRPPASNPPAAAAVRVENIRTWTRDSAASVNGEASLVRFLDVTFDMLREAGAPQSYRLRYRATYAAGTIPVLDILHFGGGLPLGWSQIAGLASSPLGRDTVIPVAVSSALREPGSTLVGLEASVERTMGTTGFPVMTQTVTISRLRRVPAPDHPRRRIDPRLTVSSEHTYHPPGERASAREAEAAPQERP
jgi:hypothetical protein